jgi:hypothetical protein
MTDPICTHTCHDADAGEWDGWCDDCATPHEADLVQVARQELINLWSDMYDALESAIRTDWSMRMENLASRIVALSRLVGVAPWDNIQVRLLRSGIYERVHQTAGLAYPAIDWPRVAQVEERIAGRSR